MFVDWTIGNISDAGKLCFDGHFVVVVVWVERIEVVGDWSSVLYADLIDL